MAKKQTVPALVPPEEQPYPIPANWRWVRLGSVSTNQYGFTAKAIRDSKYPLMLRITDIQNGNVDWSNVPHCIIQADEYRKFALKSNDIVIARTGATTGKSYILNNPPVSVFASYLVRLRIQEEVALPKYVFEFMQSHLYWYQISELSVGIAQPGVNSSKLSRMLFPLPPISEQQRIVDRIEKLFSMLDEARDKAQAVVDGYELRRAAILHKAFTGELTANQRNKRDVDFSTWEKTTLSNVVLEFRYGTSEKSSYDFSGMPVLRIPNIGENTIDFSDIKFLRTSDMESNSQIHEGDILIIRSNGSRDLVGKSALVPKLEREYAYASFLIRIIPNQRINADFLVLFLNSTSARIQMFQKAKSTSGIHNINSKELGAVEIDLPELWEQKEIVEFVSSFMEREQQAKTSAETVLTTIDMMKKKILGLAFRGLLGTNDPAEPCAETGGNIGCP